MSKLEVGIVGLPNVGKSTLFNALTKASVNVANYPFATVEPNVGVVAVPDERLDKLAEVSNAKEKIPAVVEFYDIAGLIKGASKGGGLGNKFLAQIRETHAIVHVVRCFVGDEVVHIEGSPNPLRDISTIEIELILKDLETVERHLENFEKKIKTGDKKLIKEKENFIKIKNVLLAEELLIDSSIKNDEEIKEALKSFHLLTDKPQIFLFNGKQEDVSEELIEKAKKTGFDYVIADLSVEENIPELIKKSYQTLNLITFFTIREQKTRAWTVERGAPASKAAGVIHTDFEKNFVKAEVVSYESLIAAGGWNKAKEKGEVAFKGKDYVVQDGDVIYFRAGK